MKDKISKSEIYSFKTQLEGERISLFELAIWKNGLPFKKIDFSKKGKPIIKIAELNNGISNNTSFSEKEYSKDVFLTYGDLVFSWSGNPQTSIDIYRYKLQDGWLNQHIFKVTPHSIVDKDYFFYIMKYLKPNFTKIATNKQTTGLGHVTLSDIKRISIALPKISIQKKIASILSEIDSKIELNSKINNNLEQQAQALIKQHIIGLETTISLDEFCDIFTGRKNANEFDKNGSNKFFTCGPEILSINSFIYDGPAVIISGNGAYTGRTRFYNGKFDLYQRTYACTIKENIKQNYIYLLFPLLKMELEKRLMGGTHGSAIPYIVMNDIAKFEVPFEEGIFDTISLVCKSIVDKLQANQKENEKLAQLRDALLPKLMSGEIDVSNVNIDDLASADKLSFIIIYVLLRFVTQKTFKRTLST